MKSSWGNCSESDTVFEPCSPWPVVTFMRDIGLRPANRCSVNTRSSRHVALLTTLLNGSSWEGKRKNGRIWQAKNNYFSIQLSLSSYLIISFLKWQSTIYGTVPKQSFEEIHTKNTTAITPERKYRISWCTLGIFKDLW